MDQLTFLVLVIFFTFKRGKKTCNKRAVSPKQSMKGCAMDLI